MAGGREERCTQGGVPGGIYQAIYTSPYTTPGYTSLDHPPLVRTQHAARGVSGEEAGSGVGWESAFRLRGLWRSFRLRVVISKRSVSCLQNVPCMTGRMSFDWIVDDRMPVDTCASCGKTVFSTNQGFMTLRHSSDPLPIYLRHPRTLPSATLDLPYFASGFSLICSDLAEVGGLAQIWLK